MNLELRSITNGDRRDSPAWKPIPKMNLGTGSMIDGGGGTKQLGAGAERDKLAPYLILDTGANSTWIKKKKRKTNEKQDVKLEENPG